jgi:hypothetical protein
MENWSGSADSFILFLLYKAIKRVYGQGALIVVDGLARHHGQGGEAADSKSVAHRLGEATINASYSEVI